MLIELRDYQVSSRTDVGLVRQQNEDNLFVAQKLDEIDAHGLLVAVADGMGGHNAGEVASQVAVETMAAYYDPPAGPDSVIETDMDMEEKMTSLIKRANERILQVSATNIATQGMGTTLTAMAIRNRKAFVGHVGDCRLYLWRAGKISQVTLDHSLVQEAVREGILTPEQARYHPQRNIITRALGTHGDVEVDSRVLEVETGDIFLLASDGLHGLVDDPDLERIIGQGQGDLERITENLIAAALENGGTDNVTVVAVKCGPQTAVTPPTPQENRTATAQPESTSGPSSAPDSEGGTGGPATGPRSEG